MAIELKTDLMYDYTFWLKRRCTFLKKLYLAIKRNRAKDKSEAIAYLKSIPPIYNVISLNKIKIEFRALCSLLSMEPNFEECLDITEKSANEVYSMISDLLVEVQEDYTLKSLDHAANSFLRKQLKLLLRELNALNDIKLYEFKRAIDEIQLRDALNPLLKQKNNTEINQEPNLVNLKWPWLSSPAEYAAIRDILIETGHLGDLPYKSQKVRLSLNTYDIRTQTGEPVSEKHLTDCFGRHKYQFMPGEIKIPLAKNYGKRKKK